MISTGNWFQKGREEQQPRLHRLVIMRTSTQMGQLGRAQDQEKSEAVVHELDLLLAKGLLDPVIPSQEGLTPAMVGTNKRTLKRE